MPVSTKDICTLLRQQIGSTACFIAAHRLEEYEQTIAAHEQDEMKADEQLAELERTVASLRRQVSIDGEAICARNARIKEMEALVKALTKKVVDAEVTISVDVCPTILGDRTIVVDMKTILDGVLVAQSLRGVP